MKKRCFKGGFTLIELLVVVLIIGILAAIALPQYNRVVERAHASEAIAMLSSVEKAIDLWILEHGFPSAEQVDFLGRSSHQNELHLEMPAQASSARCGASNFFVDKHFIYVAQYYAPGGDSIWISASRYLIGESGSGRQHRCWPDEDEHYLLANEINPDGTKERWCYHEDEMGKHVCESLSSQGWTDGGSIGEGWLGD